MVEKGVLDSVKDGLFSGAFAGFSIASIRIYLNTVGVPSPKPTESTARLPSSSSTTSAALLRKSPLPQLLRTTSAFAGLGALYLGTETLLRNNRDKDDVWNRLIAGSLSGSLVGLRTGSVYISGGAAASIAAATLLLHLCDGKVGSMKEEELLAKREAIYQD